VTDFGNLQLIGGDMYIEPEKVEMLGIDKIKAICPNYSA